jgi:hypothetical protein
MPAKLTESKRGAIAGVQRQGVRTCNIRKLNGIELPEDNFSEPVKVAQAFAAPGGGVEEIMPKK